MKVFIDKYTWRGCSPENLRSSPKVTVTGDECQFAHCVLYIKHTYKSTAQF